MAYWISFWVMMAVITAMVASSRGRSAIGFFIYGLLIWPVALTHALISPRQSPAGTAAPQPFVPHGMIGARPFVQHDDGPVTVMVDGREVLFPDRQTAVSALGGEVRTHREMPVLEADFDDDGDDDAEHLPGRSYPSFVAGLSHPVKWKGSNRSRSRYAFAEVRPGDRLDHRRIPDHPDDPGAVALLHHGFPLGFVPRRHGWVGKSIDEGDGLAIVVESVQRSRDNPDVAFIGTRVRVVADG